MNNRIQELVDETNAWCDAWCDQLELTNQNEYNQIWEKKFAELVINDAINTVEKRFMGDLNREDMEVRRCVEDLKKHFGI